MQTVTMRKVQPFMASRAPGVSCARPVRGVRIMACAAPVPPEGSTVRVIKSTMMFHVPKKPEGLDINGMEGVLSKDVTNYKGKILSANFQYKVDFLIPNEEGARPTKFSAHLADDEFELKE